MSELKEWEHHIKVETLENGVPIAYCGKTIGPFEWAFLDAPHAFASIQTGNYHLPCEACWKAILDNEK